MVERRARRQPGVENERGESQPRTGRSVRFENAAPKPERVLAPVEQESELETITYAPGQHIELMNNAGAPEDWVVTSVNPEDHTVFLKRQGDTRTAPSLEVISQTELALEEATRPLAQQAGELWDELLAEYAQAPGTRTPSEVFTARLNESKGRVLRLAALEAFQNYPEVVGAGDSEALKLVLDKVLSQYLIAEAHKRHDGDPRHEQAEKLRNTAQYYEAAAAVHTFDPEVTENLTLAEFVRAKVQILTSDSEPKYVIQPDFPRGLSTPDKLKVQVAEGWRDLHFKAKQAEMHLHLEDPSSAKIRDMYAELQNAFSHVNKLEAQLNDARIQAGSHEAERDAWENVIGKLEATEAMSEDRQVKLAAKTKLSTVGYQPPQEFKPEPKPVAPPAPSPTLSRLARFLNTLTNLFGL